MATETQTHSTTAPTALPKAGDVKPVSSSRSFRFSKGRIVTGREEDGSFMAIDRIVGRIIRIGIHEGKTKDFNKPYSFVECDIETAEGKISLHSDLLDGTTFEIRPSTSALNLGWGLTQVKDQSQIWMITASLGRASTDEFGRPQAAPTYANFSLVDANLMAHPVYKPKRDPNAPKSTAAEKWAPIAEELRRHPLFAERPSRARDEDDTQSATTPNQQNELAFLNQECTAKGWPKPEDAPAEWLGMLAKAFKSEVKASIAGYSNADWAEVRKLVAGLKAIPAPLQNWLSIRKAATDKTATIDASAFSDDPFENE